MSIAVEVAKDLKFGQKCVVILPDSIRNYMTKFLSPDWMIANDFLDAHSIYSQNDSWRVHNVSNLNVSSSNKEYILYDKQTLSDAINSFKDSGLQELSVLSTKSNNFVGVVSQKNLLNQLNKGRKLDIEVSEIVEIVFQVKGTTTLGVLASIFNTVNVVSLLENKRLITRLDLLNHINKLNL